MGECGKRPPYNQELLLFAALASIRIAQGLSADQIELLAAFFQVLGDNLALLITPPCSPLAQGETVED